MVHFDALIPKIESVFQYFEILRWPSPAEVFPQPLFLHVLLRCSRTGGVILFVVLVIRNWVQGVLVEYHSDAFIASRKPQAALESVNII